MDPYNLHKLALKPLLSSSPKEEFKTIASNIHKITEATLLHFLAQNMLTPLWHETLVKHNATSFFSKGFTGKLKQASLIAAARYMQQEHVLNQAAEALNSSNIPYAVFKGANIREQIYDNPALRPSDDIDILVSKAGKLKTIKVLVKSGFTFHPEPISISHEATLIKNGVKIDLHWDILRPGRTRIDMTDSLLATRKEFTKYWGLESEAELFIMLVHSVFTKYVTSPQASIIRLIDLARWIELYDIDWDKVYAWLINGGVKTPAWVTAQWLEMITEKTLPESFITKIKPSGMKALYLKKWLQNNLSSRLLDYHFLIRTCFTLPVHDKFSDALRVIKIFRHEKNRSQEQIQEINTVINI